MKKIFASMMVAVLAVSLAACGGSKDESEVSSTTAPAASTQATDEADDTASTADAVDPDWNTIQIATFTYSGDATISVSYPKEIELGTEDTGEVHDYSEYFYNNDEENGYQLKIGLGSDVDDYFEKEKSDWKDTLDVFEETTINGCEGFEGADDDRYIAKYLVDSVEAEDVEDVEGAEDILVEITYSPGALLEEGDAVVGEDLSPEEMMQKVHDNEEIQKIIGSIKYEGLTQEEEETDE